MTEAMDRDDLRARLDVIESMIAEGRRSTGRWGWIFVLWGVAYLVATAWSTLGHSQSAWPVTMVLASVVCTVAIKRTQRSEPMRGLSRAVGVTWCVSGVSLFLILFCLGISGRYDIHVFLTIIGGMLGLAHAASSLMLRLKSQMLCALLWWAAGICGCFLTEKQASLAFLAAILLGQVVFGLYVMLVEGRWAKSEAHHG